MTNPIVSSISNRFGADFERLAADVLGVGRMWAAHGLSVGRSALEASAKTLEVSARLLGELGVRVAVPDGVAVPTPSAAAEPVKSAPNDVSAVEN